MKQINKGREPRSLIEHRAKGGDFDGLPKDELREQLLAEQGCICCYCMKRIPQTLPQEQTDKNYPRSKVEHVLSQENNPDQQLNYQNLLAACNGNHGQPKNVQTCDSYKGKQDFHFNPSDRRNIEELIKYNGLGQIYSDEPLLNKELEEVLNLNTYDLKRIRAERYKFFSEMIALEGKRRNGKEIQRRFYEAEKRKLLRRIENKFTEYCMVGVYLINKKIQKLI